MNGSIKMPGRRTTPEIVIVGGGGSGVELAAELRDATHSGIDTLMPPEKVHINVIEASDRLVPGQSDTTISFVHGDSACCPWTGKDTPVPPRAQAAIQQAAFMVGQVRRRLAD